MAYVCPYRHDGVEHHPPGLDDLAALGLPHPDRAAVPINWAYSASFILLYGLVPRVGHVPAPPFGYSPRPRPSPLSLCS